MLSAPDDPHTAAAVVEGEASLAPLATTLVAALPAHAWIAVSGDLGAGKTTFVKALAAAAGIDPSEVVSPTFGLIHIHEMDGPTGRLHLVHADLYRLSGLDELRETGWEDATAPRQGTRVWVFVEWPERIASALPADRIDLAIGIDSETRRTLTFTSRGPTHEAAITAIRHHRPV